MLLIVVDINCSIGGGNKFQDVHEDKIISCLEGY